tara:strand:- start:79 stop:807 length:729 start_codon:yes stop_codon:yes gene_type:complete
MATTTATITVSSTDLLTDELGLTSTTTLTTAGTSTGVTQATGLSRKTLTYGSVAAIVNTTLYRSGDYTANKANKVYVKNTSTTPAEYFTIKIDNEEMGRLYAGDWCFFPWSAAGGTKETFVVTATGTVAVGESWEFDGVTTVSTSAVLNTFAAQVDAQVYPNWVTTVSGAAVTFVARYAASDGVITSNTAITGDVLVESGDGNFTMPITGGDAGGGTSSTSDITIEPSVHTGMTYETMLIHE